MASRNVEVVVRGHQLPGRSCGDWTNLHVGLQVGSHAENVIPADVPDAEWLAQVEVISAECLPDGDRDFRGPAVHGPRGSRFLYLTWGELDGAAFSIVRRAKLMLADLVTDDTASSVVVDVDLTDDLGFPRCARVRDAAVHARS